MCVHLSTKERKKRVLTSIVYRHSILNLDDLDTVYLGQTQNYIKF